MEYVTPATWRFVLRFKGYGLYKGHIEICKEYRESSGKEHGNKVNTTSEGLYYLYIMHDPKRPMPLEKCQDSIHRACTILLLAVLLLRVWSLIQSLTDQGVILLGLRTWRPEFWST